MQGHLRTPINMTALEKGKTRNGVSTTSDEMSGLFLRD
jgi:hypothetical protein